MWIALLLCLCLGFPGSIGWSRRAGVCTACHQVPLCWGTQGLMEHWAAAPDIPRTQTEAEKSQNNSEMHHSSVTTEVRCSCGIFFRVLSEAINASAASKPLCFHAFRSMGTSGKASTVPALSCSSRSYSYLAISALHANKYMEGEEALESQRASNLPSNFS